MSLLLLNNEFSPLILNVLLARGLGVITIEVPQANNYLFILENNVKFIKGNSALNSIQRYSNLLNISALKQKICGFMFVTTLSGARWFTFILTESAL